MSEINIKHLEKLAKLDLPSSEEKSLQADLAKLVDKFAELLALDSSLGGANESGSASDAISRQQELRADERSRENISIEDVLDQAPNKLGSAFGVPRVL